MIVMKVNLLKPALSRGEIHCIGATTDSEFQQFFMNDQALERRLKSFYFEPLKKTPLKFFKGFAINLRVTME